MSVIHNEQTKYIANACDRASTSCLTVGVLAPIAAAIYAPTGSIGKCIPAGLCRCLSAFRRSHITFVGYDNSEAAMNGLQIYAFIVLPLSIAAAGWAYACFWLRNDKRKHGE